jgi:hypothetical protein
LHGRERRDATGEEAAVIDALERAVRSRWPELGLPGKAPRALSFLLFEGSPGRHGTAFVNIFRDQDPIPLLVGKIPRDGIARRRVLHEHEILRELEEAAPRLAGLHFPRPLLAERTPNRAATGQTILAGVPIPEIEPVDGRPQAARRAYTHARNWLVELWKGTGLLGGSEAALWDDLLRAVRFCLEALHPSGDEKYELESVIWEIEARRDETSLCCYGHGALRLNNLRVRGARVGATDWEHGARRQFPWVDPVHFAIDYSARQGEIEGEPLLSGFERGFFKAGWLRDLNREFLEECLHEGGVPLDRFPLALIASVLSSMNRRARAFALDDPRCVQWRSIVERCLRPGARDELLSFWIRST